MTANPTPRISAAVLTAAATRLIGTVVLDLADMTTAPARYLARLDAFVAVDSDEVLGDDDGTLVDLLDGVPARDLIADHGTAGAAAAAVNKRLRLVWAA